LAISNILGKYTSSLNDYDIALVTPMPFVFDKYLLQEFICPLGCMKRNFLSLEFIRFLKEFAPNSP
jgi:hypothetical protein